MLTFVGKCLNITKSHSLKGTGRWLHLNPTNNHDISKISKVISHRMIHTYLSNSHLQFLPRWGQLSESDPHYCSGNFPDECHSRWCQQRSGQFFVCNYPSCKPLWSACWIPSSGSRTCAVDSLLHYALPCCVLILTVFVFRSFLWKRSYNPVMRGTARK